MSKIKLLIFDLDGVLIDSKHIHYASLNKALAEIDDKYIISEREQILYYEGLSTLTKLKKRSSHKNLPIEYHKQIWIKKQYYTYEMIYETVTIDHRLCAVISLLKMYGYKIHCASNCIKNTMNLILKQLGLIDYFDYCVSNQDVKNPKPHSEMYLKCMVHAHVSPQETLIMEDSDVGKIASLSSGAYLCCIINSTDVTLSKIRHHIRMTEINSFNPKYKTSIPKMKVIIPMSGHGSRFSSAGYIHPKPLIPIVNKPMIQIVVENLNIEAEYIFIVKKN